MVTWGLTHVVSLQPSNESRAICPRALGLYYDALSFSRKSIIVLYYILVVCNTRISIRGLLYYIYTNV